MRTRNGMLATVLVVLMIGISTQAASAKPPAGASWTFLRKDAFPHYACKVWKPQARRWNVYTATWFAGRRFAVREGIGAYAALARGSNRRVVASNQTGKWPGTHIRFLLPGAVGTDRVWVQGAYYGPPAPWSNGVSVRRIGNCRG